LCAGNASPVCVVCRKRISGVSCAPILNVIVILIVIVIVILIDI